jgi:hypothetical protein
MELVGISHCVPVRTWPRPFKAYHVSIEVLVTSPMPMPATRGTPIDIGRLVDMTVDWKQVL